MECKRVLLKQFYRKAVILNERERENKFFILIFVDPQC